MNITADIYSVNNIGCTDEAFKWYKQADDQKEPLALQKIGLMYLQGQGVQEDAIEAWKYYDLSIKAGNPSAAVARANLTKTLTEADLIEAKRRVDLALGTKTDSASSTNTLKAEAVSE